MFAKQLLNEYFSFSKKERKGALIIIAIVILLIIAPLLFPYFIKPKQYNYDDFKNEIALLNIEKNDSVKNKSYYKSYNNVSYNTSGTTSENTKAEVFYFDPNTATTEEWERLGIRDKTIQTIEKYISKGGRFYKPEDISKIWGLSLSDTKRLIPYVSIKNLNKEKDYSSFNKKENEPAASPVGKTIKAIDINNADTSAFISLPGIGSKLAQRIIAFRNKLGGFYSINQVGETYMLPDSTFQKIKPLLTISNLSVKKININTASVDEMKSHPYLRYSLANAIFQYRQQHGNFNSVEGIKKIMTITDDVYIKIAPYLTIQ